MRNIINIFVGWFLFLFDRGNYYREKRMPICKPCELNINNKCSVCGCPLEPKTRVKSETCEHPEGSKW